MVGFLVLIFVTANYVGMISGLRCWTCENSDLFQCKRNGAIEYCNKHSKETCQTEVRYSEGNALIVKTGCKQIRACVNNFYQNPAGAWMPTQCNSDTVNSVCRCCCSSNLCNKRRHNLLCSFPPQRMNDVPVVEKFPKEEKSCGPYPNIPDNGQIDCIGGFALRSFCKFSCDEGYRLKGYDISVCVQRERDFVWNREGPKCEREVICEKQPTEPVNGHSECFGERELGSACAFACDTGYKIVGSAETTCLKTEHGAEWSHETPKCNPVCHSFPSTPQNGIKACHGDGSIGTVCTFNCRSGYEMNGHSSTVCTYLDASAAWSHNPPICRPVCKSLPNAPQNGKKTCFGNGEVGSSCAFECDSGFRMSGLGNTICEEVDTRAFWTAEPPTCEPVCNALPKYPENGMRKCNGDGRLGTTCVFECKVGFKINGSLMTTCQKNGMKANWDNEFPNCEPFCLELPSSPRDGRKRCNGGGQIGTICVFECNKGFRLEGLQETKCQKTPTGADWTSGEATCSPVCDLMPTTPENGNKFCDGRGEIGTLCTFECKAGYELVGQYSVACKQTIAGAEWTDTEPVCSTILAEVVPTCHPLGGLPRGKIVCDDPINKEGTICRFECLDVGYELVPGDQTFTVCKAHPRLEWTVKKPCCVECSKSKKDIVIAMDSSASINPREWKTMQNFVVNIIRKFHVSEDGVQFSIFQFSSGAKSDGFMYFGRYTKQELIRKVGRMRRIGTGTMTGRALKYAGRRFRDEGNRKEVDDMLWVLTDGEAEDMDDLEKVSEKLRKDGVEVCRLHEVKLNYKV